MLDNEKAEAKRKGAWGEYHVNNTLHRLIGAKRFRNTTTEPVPYYLFDDFYLPMNNNKDRLTEIDHALICPKGIFSIETKTYKGRMFGEKDSTNWHSAAYYHAAERNSIRDRTIPNPFNQNYAHVRAIAPVLGIDYKTIHNYVVFIEADYDGWLEGDWGSNPIKDLYLSAHDLANHIQSMPDVLSHQQVFLFAKGLHAYYEDRAKAKVIFDRQYGI